MFAYLTKSCSDSLMYYGARAIAQLYQVYGLHTGLANSKRAYGVAIEYETSSTIKQFEFQAESTRLSNNTEKAYDLKVRVYHNNATAVSLVSDPILDFDLKATVSAAKMRLAKENIKKTTLLIPIMRLANPTIPFHHEFLCAVNIENEDISYIFYDSIKQWDYSADEACSPTESSIAQKAQSLRQDMQEVGIKNFHITSYPQRNAKSVSAKHDCAAYTTNNALSKFFNGEFGNTYYSSKFIAIISCIPAETIYTEDNAAKQEFYKWLFLLEEQCKPIIKKLIASEDVAKIELLNFYAFEFLYELSLLLQEYHVQVPGFNDASLFTHIKNIVTAIRQIQDTSDLTKLPDAAKVLLACVTLQPGNHEDDMSKLNNLIQNLLKSRAAADAEAESISANNPALRK